MVAPAEVGVTVTPGEHEVVFQFRGYSSYPWLFLVSALTLIFFGLGAIFWPRVRRRVRRRRVVADSET